MISLLFSWFRGMVYLLCIAFQVWRIGLLIEFQVTLRKTSNKSVSKSLRYVPVLLKLEKSSLIPGLHTKGSTCKVLPFLLMLFGVDYNAAKAAS